jgi:rhamnosyltransferase
VDVKTPFTIAAVVVMYNPDESLIGNLLSFLPAVSRIYVIDNSDSKNDGLIMRIREMEAATYIDNGGNKGIAEALNQGARYASRDGFGWLLTMDQDSGFSDLNYFEAFYHYADKSRVAIFSPTHSRKNKEDDVSHYAFCEKDIVMTSGNLLNLKVYYEVGPFLEKLFIDEVDHEYCLRARKKGFKIIEFSNVLLNHNLGVTIVYNKKKVTVHQALRVYYMTRNGLYVVTRNCFYFPKVAGQRLLNLFMIYVEVLAYQENKRLKLMMGIMGLWDFVVGRYGKR